jgi:CRISPR-associated protein Csh2
MENKLEKSEILFLYETSYNIPNGDPFTGEQRYDEETKKILVSDVRIKRFVRDYLGQIGGNDIYIQSKSDGDDSQEDTSDNNDSDSEDKATGSGSARRIDELISKYSKEIKNAVKESETKDSEEVKDSNKKKGKKSKFSQALYVMKKCIDVRLFGGISTKKTDAVNLTGPVQFSLLNPSLNSVELRMHQNTSVFESKQGKSQGAIATTTIVPYSIMQIHGWVNPQVATASGMEAKDLESLYQGLWYGTSGDGSSFSRSKVGQNSVLLVEIVYAAPNKKIYGADRLISIKPKDDKKGENIRSMDDYNFDFKKLTDLQTDDRIEKVRFYTEIPEIEKQFKEDGKDEFISKFEKMTL